MRPRPCCDLRVFQMSANERLLKDFEAVTAEVTSLEARLAEATARRDRIRRDLRAALRNGASRPEEDGVDDDDAPHSATATADAIRAHGQPVDAAKLGELLGVTPSIARTRLQRAAKLRLLRRVSRGQYEVVSVEE